MMQRVSLPSFHEITSGLSQQTQGQTQGQNRSQSRRHGQSPTAQQPPHHSPQYQQYSPSYIHNTSPIQYSPPPTHPASLPIPDRESQYNSYYYYYNNNNNAANNNNNNNSNYKNNSYYYEQANESVKRLNVHDLPVTDYTDRNTLGRISLNSQAYETSSQIKVVTKLTEPEVTVPAHYWETQRAGYVEPPESPAMSPIQASSYNGPSNNTSPNTPPPLTTNSGGAGHGGEAPNLVEDEASPEMSTARIRTIHKLAERRRRREMKDLFDHLRRCLPVDKSVRLSKWEVLKKAIEVISRQDSEIQMLRASLDQM